jgi:Flp pilus assembly protein TadB
MAGALAPEIVRLYEIRNDPDRFQWSWFYLVVSVAFACLGGLLAVVLPATTYWGALYVGVSTPVLVNSMVRKGRERGRSELPELSEFRAAPPRSTPRPTPGRRSLVDSYLGGL